MYKIYNVGITVIKTFDFPKRYIWEIYSIELHKFNKKNMDKMCNVDIVWQFPEILGVQFSSALYLDTESEN